MRLRVECVAHIDVSDDTPPTSRSIIAEKLRTEVEGMSLGHVTSGIVVDELTVQSVEDEL